MDGTLLGQWSPPYTYPTPTPPLPHTFIFNFLIISFIFIENKYFSDVIWNLKRERKKLVKRWFRTRVNHIKMSTTHILPSAALELITVNNIL